MKHAILLSQLAAALALTAVLAPPAHSAPAEHSISPLWRFSDGSVVEGATSQLVRTDSGISLSQRTSAPAGHAVTVWWVIFNNPENCAGAEGVPTRCAEPDLFNPDVEGSVQYAAGHVVGAAGTYSVGSYLAEGDTANCPFEAFGFLCAGLIDARKADVHLVVRTHGPKLTAFMPGQIKSFEAACTPESSLGLGDGPNTCMDMQFAVHETD
jgi:hypothetical protein